MSNLFDLVESYDVQRASVRSLFGDTSRIPVTQTPEYEARLAQGIQLIAAVQRGEYPPQLLQEAMTTDQFPLVMADILDRSLLARYQEHPVQWPAYCRRRTVKDFREIKIYDLFGASSSLSMVPEQAEYPEAVLQESRTGYRVWKYGRIVSVSWESLVNDDLNFLQRIPEELGRAARRTEEKVATSLYMSATGPKLQADGGPYTSSGITNLVTGNPPLTIEALETALTQLAKMTDEDGEPIIIGMVTLVVPPDLEVAAYKILNALQLRTTSDGGSFDSASQVLVTTNWIRERFKVVVNPYIPFVGTGTGNGGKQTGTTSWFLFGDPGSNRTAIELAFLRGYETPMVVMKTSDIQMLSGGGSPLIGDFATDTIRYRVSFITGGGVVDPRMTMASRGDSSS
jgi:hypothetical protein